MFLNYYHFHKLSLTFRDWTIDSQAVSQRDIHKILLPQPMLVVLSAFSFVFCVIYCVEVTSLVIGKYGSLSICRDFRCFLPSAFIIFMNVPHLKFLLLLNLFRLFFFFLLLFVCFSPLSPPSLALASNWTSYWKDQVQIQYFEPADLLSACHQSKEQSMVQLLLIVRNAKLHIKCLPFNKPLELKLNICTSICV